MMVVTRFEESHNEAPVVQGYCVESPSQPMVYAVAQPAQPAVIVPAPAFGQQHGLPAYGQQSMNVHGGVGHDGARLLQH